MTRERKDGLILLMLGGVVFLVFGFALENLAPVTTQDFKVVYYSARCLLDHRDPYNENDLDYVYHAEGGESPRDTPAVRDTERHYPYFPSAFAVTIPFALFQFGPAHILWLLFTAASLALGSLLMWDVGAKFAPVLSGGLVGLSLANCMFFLAIGNPGGITVGLCLVAFWCFLRNRFVPAGVLALSVSLLLKPHVAGLIWLYFVFAGRANRMRAFQTAAVTGVLSLISVLWLSQIAPHWALELRSILHAYSAPGGINDPGPASKGGHGIGMIISLQAPLSFFWDNPAFYNIATYIICGVLLLVWIYTASRSRFSPQLAWFAIAPIAVLSLLPVYHRLGDSKLLLLTIPAGAILWVEGGSLRWWALAVNCAEFLLTGEPQWAIFFAVVGHLRGSTHSISGQMLQIVQVFPVPVILFISCIFYLCVYVKRATGEASRQETGP